RTAGPLEPRAEGLARVAFGGEATDDAHGRFRRVLGGQAQGLLAEVRLRLADVAAEQHLVAGRRFAVGAPLGTEEPDVGDVVLAARVRAAGDVRAHAAHVGQPGGLERL